jgi:hypothetical protein
VSCKAEKLVAKTAMMKQTPWDWFQNMLRTYDKSIEIQRTSEPM